MSVDPTALLTEQLVVTVVAPEDHRILCGDGDWWDCALRAAHAWVGRRAYTRMLRTYVGYVDQMARLVSMPGETPESLALPSESILAIAAGCVGELGVADHSRRRR